MKKRGTPELKPRLIDGRGRVAVPGDVMEALGVENGDYIAFEVRGGRVEVFRVEMKVERRPASPDT